MLVALGCVLIPGFNEIVNDTVVEVSLMGY